MGINKLLVSAGRHHHLLVGIVSAVVGSPVRTEVPIIIPAGLKETFRRDKVVTDLPTVCYK